MICCFGSFEGEMICIVNVETSPSKQIPLRPVRLAPGQRPPTHPEDPSYKAGPLQPQAQHRRKQQPGRGQACGASLDILVRTASALPTGFEGHGL